MMPMMVNTRRDRAGPGELAGDARADHLDAAVFVVGRAERRLHLLHHRLLRRVAARLHARRGSARRVGSPMPCTSTSPSSSAVDLLADVGEVGRRRVAAHLDDRAALEVDALVEADGEEAARTRAPSGTSEIGVRIFASFMKGMWCRRE